MEFFSDFKFWIFFTQVIILAFSWFSHQKIVYNDLKHLAQDTKDIKSKQDKQGEEIGLIKSEVAYIKGMKENEDKVIKLLETTLKNK
jgi:hypothetical protein